MPETRNEDKGRAPFPVTNAMLDAGLAAMNRAADNAPQNDDTERFVLRAVYRAMRALAPDDR